MKKLRIFCLLAQIVTLNMFATYCQAADSIRGNPAYAEQQYQQALSLYKQDKADESLSILDDLYRNRPEVIRYLYDYVAIASWSGKHELAVSAGSLNLEIAPAYVLEAVASSQRQLENYDASIKAYDFVVQRFPERTDAQLARINTLIDAQRYQEAEAGLSRLRKQFPQRVDVMESVIRWSDGAMPPINTLTETDRLLAIDSDNTFALKMRYHALKKLGAVHLAGRVTPDSLLSSEEQSEDKRDQLAFELRWARINADKLEHEARWAELDAVIDKLDQVCQSAQGEGAEFSVARASCGDLVAALSERKRSKAAITLYEKMLEKNWPVYAYVQSAVADAYQEQQQPESALTLFDASLKQAPDNFWGKVGRVYALLDSEHYCEAYESADRLAAETPEWINAESPDVREPNSAFIHAQLLSARIRGYTNKLSEAEAKLQTLAFRAPANTQIRQALAATYSSRGWPRRAEGDLEWLDAAEPNNLWTQLGLFENRMAVGDYKAAEVKLDDVTEQAPDEKAVRRANRDWQTHNLRELVVESRFGRSSDLAGASPNSHESVIEAHLYASPIKSNWRPFLHTQFTRGDLPGLSVSRVAMGAGTEYQLRDLNLRGELLRVGDSGIGYALKGGYRIGDHWYLNAGLDQKSLATPIKAYADGVTASNIRLGGGYRWHESRDVYASLNQMTLSDGNTRNATDIFWTERWFASPTYILSSVAEYYASQNALQSPTISYFNPDSDQFVGATIRNEWMQFHHYRTSLTHALSIGLGNYAQQSFSTGQVKSVSYELTYTHHDRLNFRAGVSRSEHPYDGVVDVANNFTLGMRWRF